MTKQKSVVYVKKQVKNAVNAMDVEFESRSQMLHGRGAAWQKMKNLAENLAS